MDIRKTPGDVIRHDVSREDMILINRLSKSELTPEQVYTFALRLCDNEIDRDWERFDEDALDILSGLFVGKSGIFDHNWSAEGQTARLYKTEVCREGGTTEAGDDCRFLKGYAYMLRNEKNAPLIEEIEAGIKKEVSIGCSVTDRCCSICGKDQCEHRGGRTYIEIESDLALIAVVGRGMKSTRGTAGRIFSALAHANVNVKMIDQGSSELNIIIGVSDEDFETAIKAIYDIFVLTNL